MKPIFSVHAGDGYASAIAQTNGTLIDTTAPLKPGQPFVSAPTQVESRSPLSVNLNTPNFTLSWAAAADVDSGIRQYELEERTDVFPVWSNILPSRAAVTSFTLENKAQQKSYNYRVRAQNWAGTWSNYSELSKNIVIGAISEIVSQVSNWPNPFNSNNEVTTITFKLGTSKPSYDVRIDIFDLFGNKVLSKHYPNQAPGANFTSTWDGTNEIGKKVSTGGYICRITVKGGNETVTKTRKIGVIH